MSDLVRIELKNVVANPLNKRSMNDGEIDNIARSISESGLLTPITVYKKGDNYVLLSGHRRVEALRRNGARVVDAYLHKAPKNEVQEAELLAQGNIHRLRPHEAENEVNLMNDAYLNLTPEERKVWKEKLEKVFIERYQKHQAYLENPKKFMTDFFRPKYEYIRANTGLEISNTTVKKIIAKCMGDEVVVDNPSSESEASVPKTAEKSEKKEKRITNKNIIKTAESLIGMLKLYEAEDMSDWKRDEVLAMKDDITSYLEEFVNLVEE